MINNKIPLQDLAHHLSVIKCALICCASFEERSKVIPEALQKNSFDKTIIFACEDCDHTILESARIISSYYSNKSIVNKIRRRSPIYTADIITKAVKQLISEGTNQLIIDISTFTHEILLILLAVINSNKEAFTKITCLYLGASDYSIEEKPENKWLSKGCKELRSVIGYPGHLTPGRPTCLIVLVGYEHERAIGMIDEMNPELLILGNGIPSEDSLTNPSHKVPMLHFQRIVKELVAYRDNVSEFEFSCRDIVATKLKIEEQINNNPGYNYIIVPLNTKISTVAAAKVAIDNKKIQLCYAEPETYNFNGYSLPDDKVTLFEL